jgi:hypothetical protein
MGAPGGAAGCSVILGVSLFGEMLSKDQRRLSPALLGLALAVIGVALLASPEPEPVEEMVVE